MTNNKPFAHTRLAKYVEKRVLELKPRKTQGEIATEAGFININMLTMIKNGTTKLALDRVPGLAKALDCDPKKLFAMALEQTWGSTTAKAIDEIFGIVVSRNEVVWLQEIRDASANTDPSMTTRARAAIRGIFGK